MIQPKLNSIFNICESTAFKSNFFIIEVIYQPGIFNYPHFVLNHFSYIKQLLHEFY